MIDSRFALLAQEAAAHEEMVANTGGWAQVFASLQQDHQFVLMIIAIGCITGILITAFFVISGMVRHAGELRLKRELIDRGLTAEEIAQVVEATPPTDFLERRAMHKNQ